MTSINVSNHALMVNIKSKLFKQNNQRFFNLFIIILTTLLSACQLTPPVISERKSEEISYSQYYLWLKTLSHAQVLAEEKKQKHLQIEKPQSSSFPGQSKLILIYSLPNTSLHQPYKAKRLLNEYLLISDEKSTENVAFTLLLRDQLNTQLHLLEKANAVSAACKKQKDKHGVLIEQLQKKLNQVNQQLLLLKKIDQNMNDLG
jgi:hypothetical protein